MLDQPDLKVELDQQEREARRVLKVLKERKGHLVLQGLLDQVDQLDPVVRKAIEVIKDNLVLQDHLAPLDQRVKEVNKETEE